jgi:hypothetical protein
MGSHCHQHDPGAAGPKKTSWPAPVQTGNPSGTGLPQRGADALLGVRCPFSGGKKTVNLENILRHKPRLAKAILAGFPLSPRVDDRVIEYLFKFNTGSAFWPSAPVAIARNRLMH